MEKFVSSFIYIYIYVYIYLGVYVRSCYHKFVTNSELNWNKFLETSIYTIPLQELPWCTAGPWHAVVHTTLPVHSLNIISRSHTFCVCSSHIYSCNLRNIVCARNRFQPLFTVKSKPSLLSEVQQPWLVLVFRRFGIAYRSHLHVECTLYLKLCLLGLSDMHGLSVLWTAIRCWQACRRSCIHQDSVPEESFPRPKHYHSLQYHT